MCATTTGEGTAEGEVVLREAEPRGRAESADDSAGDSDGDSEDDSEDGSEAPDSGR